MSETELVTTDPFVKYFNIFKNLKDIESYLVYEKIENSKFLNCNFETLKLISCAFVNVVFENCVIENLSIKHESLFSNVKFINCQIKNIDMIYNRVDLKSLMELQKLKSVFEIHEMQIDITRNNYLADVYDMYSEIITSELHNSFDDIRIHIGCKMKSISEWNDWFENSTEEYNTPRNTEKFERIKCDYVLFRNEALKIIENLKKGLN